MRPGGRLGSVLGRESRLGSGLGLLLSLKDILKKFFRREISMAEASAVKAISACFVWRKVPPQKLHAYPKHRRHIIMRTIHSKRRQLARESRLGIVLGLLLSLEDNT